MEEKERNSNISVIYRYSLLNFKQNKIFYYLLLVGIHLFILVITGFIYLQELHKWLVIKSCPAWTWPSSQVTTFLIYFIVIQNRYVRIESLYFNAMTVFDYLLENENILLLINHCFKILLDNKSYNKTMYCKINLDFIILLLRTTSTSLQVKVRC